jgi:cell wall-associated NlpC family hydrolase
MYTHIVEETRTWLGTRFRLYGRVKRTLTNQGGCDCIGLILGVCKNLGLKTKTGQEILLFDHFQYSLQNEVTLLENFLEQHFHQATSFQVGNIILFQMNASLQHVGVVVNYDANNLGIIHADIKSRMVVEHFLNSELVGKIAKIYCLATTERDLK